MAIYGYERVSTSAQADEGQSLGTQERMIRGYAMQHGWEVSRVFVEAGVSGSVPLAERPEGRILLAQLEPGDIVITPKLDRMFRSAIDALQVLQQLQARGVSLHMIDLGGDVTGNGISKLVFTILSAVAEAERDRTRERIRDVKRDQAKRGRFLGGHRPPFGWHLDQAGGVEPDPAEQDAVAMMRTMHAAGASYRGIAAGMRERGFAVDHKLVMRLVKESQA
jgi:DNA invertase Pin-like site-specific DNA recombinase